MNARAEPAPGPGGPAIFVGREAELGRVARELSRLRLLLVYGVAGVGKTSFLLRAAAGLDAQMGARAVYHRCRPGDSAHAV